MTRTRDDILHFLREPSQFSNQPVDPDIWMSGLTNVIKPLISKTSDFPLRRAQEEAWIGLANKRAGLILGPPGTGKTYLLSKLIVGYVRARILAGKPGRVFVSAFTRNATVNLLEAVAKEVQKLEPSDRFSTIFFGNPADGHIDPAIHLESDASRTGRLAQLLVAGPVVVGATVWGLNRFLNQTNLPTEEDQAGRFFDLVCIDEASQLVLSHGLMALAGLAKGGRIVVAGDDKQLPPIRAVRETKVDGRDIGGSLYQFLKSADVSEFVLDETFRLNETLTRFPQQKFYTGKFSSIVPPEHSNLKLKSEWAADLSGYVKAALDPEFPITVLLHDGPVASTSNAFEATLACRLADELYEFSENPDGSFLSPQDFWQKRLAIISPHRAQNALIRRGLSSRIQKGAFVETVDRIQGKERDAVILTYCVSDPEFALTESEFIFSKERLNVATTRAKSKLILIISKKLLDTLPPDQEVLDLAELLREFVYECQYVGTLSVEQSGGPPIEVEVRALGTGAEKPIIGDVSDVPDSSIASHEDLPIGLQNVFEVIRKSATAQFSFQVKMWVIQKAIHREPFEDCVQLHHIGWISLKHDPSKQVAHQWQASPLTHQRPVYACDEKTVRERIRRVIREATSPFYNQIRDRFAWMDASGKDLFRPILENLKKEGVVTLKQTAKSEVVELGSSEDLTADKDVVYIPDGALSEDDFKLLNVLEDMDAERVNFGIFEAWTSIVELSRKAKLNLTETTERIARLQQQGFVLCADEGRLRSRMAELAREIRLVKQRFRSDDSDRQPFLVRSLKLEVTDRNKPERKTSLRSTANDMEGRLPEPYKVGLSCVVEAFSSLWKTDDPLLAGFQARALSHGLLAWTGQASPTMAIAANTGSGKTEAAILPLIAGAIGDKLSRVTGVKAVLAYPRVRLVANQAQRLAYYLNACARIHGAPKLSIGMQTSEVPSDFNIESSYFKSYYAETWQADGQKGLRFPFFDCPEPDCGAPLHLQPHAGYNGADLLRCAHCNWQFDSWIGSKQGLCETPPDFFLPTTDSLHQWMHTPKYSILFGDKPGFCAPRAVLADEIHLYTHIHGAQVGMALRRALARCDINSNREPPTLAIGMSATIGDPAYAWGRLIGRNDVEVIRPEPSELSKNPRGREYYYFVQPEIESRERDIAGASTTIQALMCLAHGMRRRTAKDGGYRSLVFFDSLDKMRRLHSAYIDAEEIRNLSQYRTLEYGDDAAGHPIDGCCGDPLSCDRFTEGECWWFAANDARQWGTKGFRNPGQSLKVARQTVSSKASGRVEEVIKQSDIIFTTSSLEVGYDDPDIALVYQHYSPLNLASFVQRKGRGGRGSDDRPVTGVTLSMYSARDRWWFRNPLKMISPQGFDTPLNPENVFVVRGQVLCALLDGLARSPETVAAFTATGRISTSALLAAAPLPEAIFGPDIWQRLEAKDVLSFWKLATKMHLPEITSIRRIEALRQHLDWCPDLLFDTINLPSVAITGLQVSGGQRATPPKEDVSFLFPTIAPGNATRRFDATRVYWRPPAQGTAPWFETDDYKTGEYRQLWNTKEELLENIPSDAHELLCNVSLQIFRPRSVKLDYLGEMFKSDWKGHLDFVPSETPNVREAKNLKDTINHDSRSQLRGTVLISAVESKSRHLPVSPALSRLLEARVFAGETLKDADAGLTAARIFWAADCELKFSKQDRESESLVQVFSDATTAQPLLHGYSVDTEGVQVKLNSEKLGAFIDLTYEDLTTNAKRAGELKHYRAQFMRFLIESRAMSQGFNAYQARRGADLFVSAAGDQALRTELNAILKRWDGEALSRLFESTRVKLLAHHPMYTKRRVQKTAEALSGKPVQTLVRQVFSDVADQAQFKRYLASSVLNALALRFKQSLALVGQGDDNRLLAHVRLPAQFSGTSNPIITVCEAGAKGDGTIRAVEENWGKVLAHFSEGFISECPNADEDNLMVKFWSQSEKHTEWKNRDPRSTRDLKQILEAMDPTYTSTQMPTKLLRILFEEQSVSGRQFSLYTLASEIEEVRKVLSTEFGRDPSDWELVSRAVTEGQNNASSGLRELLVAYKELDGVAEDSLSPEARLADQVFRLSAPLCLDGCRACVHQSSDMMTDSMVETSVSRRLLSRYLDS